MSPTERFIKEIAKQRELADNSTDLDEKYEARKAMRKLERELDTYLKINGWKQ